MKAVKFFLIFAVLAWFGVLAFVGNKIYQGYASADPLRAEKVELQKVRILKDIEDLKVKQEVEQRETAIVKAKLARQERIESHQGVSFAAVVTAFFWKLSPVIAFLTAITGAGVFFIFRRVPVKTPFVETMLPVRRASEIVEKSLTVSNAAELAKAYAFQEEVSQKRLETDAKVMHSLRAGRENITVHNAPALPAPQQAVNVPKFADILSGLEPGDHMIFGYNTETGEPITGGFDRVYSSFFAGRSGSGKTAGLRSIVFQSLVTTPGVRYLVHDPHAEHKESLANTLPSCEQIAFTDRQNPIPAITAFIRDMQDRIDSNVTDGDPCVFVVDELAYCAKQKYFPTIQAAFDRISTEGRKVGFYLIASSQDARFRKTGDFRDTLSSAFLFNIKSNHVKAFSQDDDMVKLHKQVRTANRPGVALLDLTDGDPVIIQTPYCSPNDARFLPLKTLQASAGRDETRDETYTPAAENETESNYDNVLPFRRKVVNVDETTSTAISTALSGVNTVDDIPPNPTEFLENIKAMMAVNDWSLGEISRQSGVDKGQLSKILNLKTPLTVSAYQALKALTVSQQQEV